MTARFDTVARLLCCELDERRGGAAVAREEEEDDEEEASAFAFAVAEVDEERVEEETVAAVDVDEFVGRELRGNVRDGIDDEDDDAVGELSPWPP